MSREYRRNPWRNHTEKFIIKLFNYTDKEYSNLRDRIDFCHYMLLSERVCRNGNPYIEGFFITKRSYLLNEVRELFAIKAFYIPIYTGSVDHILAKYKSGRNFVELGKRYRIANSMQSNQQSSSSRDEDIVRDFDKMITDHGREGLEEFKRKYLYTCYNQGERWLRLWWNLQSPIRRDDIIVFWIHESDVADNSRIVHDLMPNAFVKDSNTKWWDGYFLEKDCLIENLTRNRGIDFDLLDTWCSPNPCRVEIKHGMIPLHVNRFVIVSDFHPAEVYSHVDPGRLAKLLERINVLTVAEFQFNVSGF